MNNYYNKPSHKKPYYYIVNRNDNDTIIINNSNNDSDTEVYISYKEGFDYYQKGVLKVNDVNETGDLMFETSNVEKRGVFTYLEYLIIIVLTLIAEYILLFRKKEKVNEKE